MRIYIRSLIISAFMVSLAAFYIWPETVKREARFAEVDGIIEVMTPGSGWVSVSAGTIVMEGSRIRTKQESTAILNVDGKGETAVVEVKENSDLVFTQLSSDALKGTKTTFIDLYLGKLTIRVAKADPEKATFQVKTPTSILDVSGATFGVSVEAEPD